MIFVDRSKVGIPTSLNGKSSIGAIELDNSIKFFSIKKNVSRKYSFMAYKAGDIKQALEALFFNKCAYCDSDVTTVYFGDVEHFRPKAEIANWKAPGRIRPGYYRLASQWDNLLLACKVCNSLKKKKVLNGKITITGKGNFFPLRGKKLHITDKASIAGEESHRLLINPCKDDPESFFKYDVATGAILTRPRTKNKIEMAETSIEIYGLHRIELAIQRQRKIVEVNGHITRAREALEDLSTARSAISQRKFQTRFEREINSLKMHCNGTLPYTAVARQLAKPFFAEIRKLLRT